MSGCCAARSLSSASTGASSAEIVRLALDEAIDTMILL